jgi:hypothetical protein
LVSNRDFAFGIEVLSDVGTESSTQSYGLIVELLSKKFDIVQLVNKFPAFMNSQFSSACPQGTTIGPYSYPSVFYIILLCTLIASKRFIFFGFSD